MVNSIWERGEGDTTPLTEKKFVEKNGKCNQEYFLQVLPKSSWTTLKTILKTLSALGVCRVNIIGRVVYKKSMIFKVFENILVNFWHFLMKSFLVARSYLVVVIIIKL